MFFAGYHVSHDINHQFKTWSSQGQTNLFFAETVSVTCKISAYQIKSSFLFLYIKEEWVFNMYILDEMYVYKIKESRIS